MTTSFQTLDHAVLVTVAGGAGETPQQQPQPAARTWRDTTRDLVGACVSTASQALIFGGRPADLRQAATTAAIGCAMGTGLKAIELTGNYLSQPPAPQRPAQ